MEKYLNSQRKLGNNDILPIYVQTYEQSSYNNVKLKGYKVIKRSEIISILGKYAKQGGSNNIALDFYSSLKEIEEKFLAFKNLPLKEWDKFAWQGFFQYIKARLKTGEWLYVPNQKGGFWGFYFQRGSIDDLEVFFQLENSKACFKIKTGTKETKYNREKRNYWYRLFIETAKGKEVCLSKPKKFGNGEHMTVAVCSEDYIVKGKDSLIDLDETLLKIEKLKGVLDEVTKISTKKT